MYYLQRATPRPEDHVASATLAPALVGDVVHLVRLRHPGHQLPGRARRWSATSWKFVYGGSATDEAIFTVNASQFASARGDPSSSLGNATDAVINVLGTGSFTAAVNFTGNVNASSLLWNFESAATFNAQRTWEGTILGPSLTLTTGGNVDGGVYVQNFTQGGEVHDKYFGGGVPETSSTPSSSPAVPLPPASTGRRHCSPASPPAKLLRARRRVGPGRAKPYTDSPHPCGSRLASAHDQRNQRHDRSVGGVGGVEGRA